MAEKRACLFEDAMKEEKVIKKIELLGTLEEYYINLAYESYDYGLCMEY